VGKKTVNTEEFIKRSQKLHGDTYDYSETIYLTAKKNVSICCRKHGIFFQKPYDHTYNKIDYIEEYFLEII